MCGFRSRDLFFFHIEIAPHWTEAVDWNQDTMQHRGDMLWWPVQKRGAVYLHAGGCEPVPERGIVYFRCCLGGVCTYVGGTELGHVGGCERAFGTYVGGCEQGYTWGGIKAPSESKKILARKNVLGIILPEILLHLHAVSFWEFFSDKYTRIFKINSVRVVYLRAPVGFVCMYVLIAVVLACSILGHSFRA